MFFGNLSQKTLGQFDGTRVSITPPERQLHFGFSKALRVQFVCSQIGTTLGLDKSGHAHVLVPIGNASPDFCQAFPRVQVSRHNSRFG